MITHRYLRRQKSTFKLNTRAVWYCVLVWLLTFFAAAVFIFPWFYLVLPFIVFWTTVYYFRSEERSLAAGLKLSLFWFAILIALDILEILGPYYSNALLYFSDVKNWSLFPLVLLIPVIYGIVKENSKFKRTRRIRGKHIAVGPRFA